LDGVTDLLLSETRYIFTQHMLLWYVAAITHLKSPYWPTPV